MLCVVDHLAGIESFYSYCCLSIGSQKGISHQHHLNPSELERCIPLQLTGRKLPVSNTSDVIVAGGGLVGSVFALAAARENLTVLAFDDAKPSRLTRFDGRAYALSLSSCRMLTALGMTDLIETHSQEILTIHISAKDHDGFTDPAQKSQFHSSEIETGPMARMIEDRHLRAAIKHELKKYPDLIRVVKARITELEFGEFTVTVQDSIGKTYQSTMVAGCDGRDGIVGKRAGIRCSEFMYDQSAIVCAVKHELPHHGGACQFFMPSGPLAILPLRGRKSSLVWTTRQDNAEHLSKMKDSDFLAKLKQPFGSFLGDISLIGNRFVFPLSQSLAEQLISRRATLLGESAHGLHPLAGQSLNLGFRDAASLAQVIGVAARRGEDIGTINVLERYQNWRRFDISLFAIATDGFNWLFSNTNPLLHTLRHGGMIAINHAPPLRRAFIREAAGLNGQMPDIMKN